MSFEGLQSQLFKFPIRVGKFGPLQRGTKPRFQCEFNCVSARILRTVETLCFQKRISVFKLRLRQFAEF